MNRTGLLAGLSLVGLVACQSWDADTAYAQCLVQSGTNTYTSGSFLSAPECDTNGKIKTSGGGGGTQYVEDTAHASGDTGTMALCVRRDANTTLADTTGDYAPCQVDANGNLKVNIIAGAGSGGTAMTDDAAFTPATTSVTPIAGTFDDTAPDSVDEGDGGAVRMSGNRNLYTTLRDAAGNERGANINASNELLTSSNTELPAAAALADNTANPTVPGVSAFLMCYDGATWDRCQASLTDTDDGSIARSQVPSLTATLGYVDDGVTWVRNFADPCRRGAKTFLPINISTATTTEITPSLAGASTHYYVCGIFILPVAGAQTLAVVDDDTDGCGSVTSGLAGGTTAASGGTIAANGGWVIGNGDSAIMKTNGTNRVICIVTGQAVQTSGTMIVVAAP